MRYLVRARVKPGREAALPEAVEGDLGEGSVAEGEYLTAGGMSDCSYGDATSIPRFPPSIPLRIDFILEHRRHCH